MLRRLPRVVYLTIIFFLSLTTLNLFLKNELIFYKNYLKKKIESNEIGKLVENPLTLLNSRFYPEVRSYEMKDWHNYEFMDYEASRVGPGENGSAVIITDPEEMKINDELRQTEGLSVLVSDKISVNRSLPDVRHKM